MEIFSSSAITYTPVFLLWNLMYIVTSKNNNKPVQPFKMKFTREFTLGGSNVRHELCETTVRIINTE